ncbi:MAG TPA: hypothetical protein VFG69_01370 [Nannocystaceae bacterium]|nr:hypothetical protein [Nannocystaceae bacterium]
MLTGRPVPMTAALANGSIEQRELAIDGLPVRGAFEVVHDDGRGTVRVTASRRPTADPQLAAADATIARADVPALVAAALDLPAMPVPERTPELVYLLVLGEAVLAWEVQLPFSRGPDGEPTRKTVWLSAASGYLLDERENVFSSRALVFPANPSSTPDPIVATLVEIDAHGPGVPLVGTSVRSLNCASVQPLESEPWHDDGECWPVARTFSDLNGDFFVPLPDVLDPASGKEGDDLYAELSMYAHAERFLAFMRERGLTEYRCEFSTMLANFRTLGASGDPADFGAVNNAYFTDQCDPELGATMLFGQGSDVDFAYDGDVIYHELGHGVVAKLAPAGLTQGRLRRDAAVTDATAVNEALADYVSVMLSGDPHLAEYVGRFWPAQSTPYIRTAENGKRCPEHTVGQSHNDGEPLMAALWATRLRLGVVLDQVVFGALTRLANDATLEEAAAALVEVAGELVLAGELAPEEVDVLARELVVRGLDDCPRVIVDPDQVAAGRTMYLRRNGPAMVPFAPGPMQLRYEVPAGSDELVVRFDLESRGNDPVTASVLVKRADAPLEFTYRLVTRDDLGDPTGASNKIREVVLVEGDWDLEVPALQIDGEEHEARVGGLRPGEVVHIGVVDTATTDAVAKGVRVVDPDGAGQGEGGSSSSGGDDVAMGAAPDEREHAESAVASCACATARGRVDPLFAIAGLALLRRRRRRPR